MGDLILPPSSSSAGGPGAGALIAQDPEVAAAERERRIQEVR
jgi:hypothetical protein